MRVISAAAGKRTPVCRPVKKRFTPGISVIYIPAFHISAGVISITLGFFNKKLADFLMYSDCCAILYQQTFMSTVVQRITTNKTDDNNKRTARFFRIPAAFLLICSFLCTALPAGAQSSRYIEKHRLLATKLSHEYDIPVAIILAVAIVESSSGQASVARRYHNHFGIAGRNRHKGKRRSRYKAYKDDAASFLDFCKVISRKRFYSELKGNTDYRLWISEISKTGYSEMPAEWQKRVLQTIAVNHL